MEPTTKPGFDWITFLTLGLIICALCSIDWANIAYEPAILFFLAMVAFLVFAGLYLVYDTWLSNSD